MTKVLTSGMAADLEKIYDEWEEAKGYGPCGAYCVIKREEGYGQIAVCMAKTKNMEMGFTHYVIWDDGIIDLSNPLGEELEYDIMDLLGDNEMPELVTTTDLDWMRPRL